MRHLLSRLYLFVMSFSLFCFSGKDPVFAQGTSMLMGIVTNAVTGNPVIGAKIIIGSQAVYSVSGGVYSMNIGTPGTYTVTSIKTGYEDFISSPVVIPSTGTVTLNISLFENVNPAAWCRSSMDSAIPSVNIVWGLPTGPYEILYDDGIQDDFTVWASGGNMNAVRFTPAGYPAILTGGSLNIGNSGNYPSGSNPLVPFQLKIFDATGPGGTPGALLAGPIDVIPTALGWVEFTLSAPVTMNSGSFYIAMVQGGSAPNAAGIAIDATFPQLRSYTKFGGAPWVPAGGNFMMRAIVSGSGGPMILDDAAGSILGYQVWRLKQGEELNPAVWTSVGFTSGTSFTDYSWPSLPCGPFRWAVKTQYTGNRWSAQCFSDIIGKCWTFPVTVHTNLSCSSSQVEGTAVRLMNLVYPDTLYTATLDTSGSVLFSQVWKGTYELKVSRFGYQTNITTASVTEDTTFTVLLLQEKSPPLNLTVNNKTLIAAWNTPVKSQEFFHESWESGNFSANGWSATGGSNWGISTTTGNPSPSAMFGWSPQKNNYNESLVSADIEGEHSTLLKLKYDIYLDNFGTTTVNQMAVELWDGAAWHTLKNYTNSAGSIPWTTEELDISGYTDITFKIRFRAYGGDSYDINSWNIDNISVTGSEKAANIRSCILGYHVYLENILLGFTADTVFTIPSAQVVYGNTYNACVQAVYGSGYSSKTCYSFTSQYLVPPTNLAGSGIENTAFLHWNMPLALLDAPGSGNPPPGLTGYKIYRDWVLLDSIPYADTLFYYDFGLNPGTYSYAVTATYDLSAYGFPGQTDESMMEGPVDVIINYGRQLPFVEPWDQASFDYNDWTFEPDQGNWAINSTEGNPPPDAEFSWSPPVTSYSYALVSPVMNATGVNCATVWLDFDYRLLNQIASGEEKLSVELLYNDVWHPLGTYSNDQEYGWTFVHQNINPAKGKGFRIRFVAHGLNSADIQKWSVDNIHVYPVCYPASNLTGDIIGGFDIQLTWSPPGCIDGNILNEGFEEEQFPPANWTQTITNPLETWAHTGISSPLGVHTGNYAASVATEYTHQDEWLIARNVAVTGPLKFWSNAFQHSVHNDHYYVKVSTDGGSTWQVLLDMSSLPTYPSSNGYNQWVDPYIIDMSYFMGMVVDIAWQAVDGDGQGLWYSWAIDDCSMGSDKFGFGGNARFLVGYDIYREDSGSGIYNKINASPITDTVYTDPGLAVGMYRYYVNAVFAECVNATPSDTLVVLITGSGGDLPGGDRITVYPNPAKDVINVKSEHEIRQAEIMNITGKIVSSREGVGSTFLTLKISGLPAGIYFLQIGTPTGIRIVKIAIER
jgi:hypothetical protein